MAMTMQVDVVSAEELIYSGVAELWQLLQKWGKLACMPVMHQC